MDNLAKEYRIITTPVQLIFHIDNDEVAMFEFNGSECYIKKEGEYYHLVFQDIKRKNSSVTQKIHEDDKQIVEEYFKSLIDSKIDVIVLPGARLIHEPYEPSWLDNLINKLKEYKNRRKKQ